MTVGETLTASNLGPGGDRVLSGGGGDPTAKVGDASQTGSVPHDVGAVTAKVGHEVVTSLHLIKDIRRLEKYQRDFFLKVKESLSHVQVLLDHQLMDMAWSDNLIECEENLLKLSTNLQQSAPLADLYGALMSDREKLTNRFHELSVKSSLSEFVVNSRQLLDVDTVRIAAETILKNEKPVPAQGDPSTPVDHTFFLANFCTASLASSMMASFMPKACKVATPPTSVGASTSGFNGLGSGKPTPDDNNSGGGLELASMMADATDYGVLYGPPQPASNGLELVSAISQITTAAPKKPWPKSDVGHMENSARPLSFARIASLNLEKQQHHGSVVPPINAFDVMNVVSMPVSPMMTQPSSNPRYFFDITMEASRLGRVIIEVQPAVAPKMSRNFHMLVTAEKGFGYRGCTFFQAWRNESVICGDWEHNSGRGGRAALDDGVLFTPDDTKLPCVRGAVGMRRMSKKHSSLNQVASQFRVILANMNTQFTGIFGHVIYGIEALDKVANIGGDGGRPEKVATVINCGIYKG